MNAPLQEFICDKCGEVINSPEEGVLEWISEWNEEHQTFVNKGFKIIHQFGHSPNQNTGCSFYQGRSGISDYPLRMYLNPDFGMANIISLLDVGQRHQPNFTIPLVENAREYAELVRRLTIEYYDEARLYWSDANNDNFFDDFNEADMYRVSKLREIIEKYG